MRAYLRGRESRDGGGAAPAEPRVPGSGTRRGLGGPGRRKRLDPALPAPAPPPPAPHHVWRFLPEPYKEFPSLSPAHTWRFLPGAAGRLPEGWSTASESSPLRRDPDKEGNAGQAGLLSGAPRNSAAFHPCKVRGAHHRHPFHLPHFLPFHARSTPLLDIL